MHRFILVKFITNRKIMCCIVKVVNIILLYCVLNIVHSLRSLITSWHSAPNSFPTATVLYDLTLVSTLPQTREDRDACFPQQDITTFSLRTAGVNRRHSTDGAISSGLARGLADSARFHPYRRQFSDGAVTAAACVQQCSPTFSCLQEVCSPDTRSYSSSNEASPPWDQYSSSSSSSVHQVARFVNVVICD